MKNIRFHIKSKTIAGDFAKTYCIVDFSESETVLVIRRLFLCDKKDIKLEELLSHNKLLKIYKNKILMETIFPIKVSTLRTISGVLDEIKQHII